MVTSYIKGAAKCIFTHMHCMPALVWYICTHPSTSTSFCKYQPIRVVVLLERTLVLFL